MSPVPTVGLGPATPWLRSVVGALALCVVLAPGASFAQNAANSTEEFDPIRCWWQTSAGAVRTGETFSVALTCAVLETDATRVVPDETKLDPSVTQLPPFEIVDGEHPLGHSDRAAPFLPVHLLVADYRSRPDRHRRLLARL